MVDGNSPGTAHGSDGADGIVEAWTRERPDLPVDSIGVVTRVWHAAKLLGDDRNRLLRRLDADAGTLDLLSTLRRGGEPYRMTTRRLAAASLITPGAITQRVERAERHGFVRRLSVAGSRAIEVELTPDGRSYVDELVGDVLRHEGRLLAGLSEPLRTRIAEDMRLLLDHLVQSLDGDSDERPGQVGYVG